ncbi:MAG: helix-turn-helix transcriptional regulator [Chloroflexota bacterium]
MSVPVNNNFGILLAEKRKREKNTIPLSDVAKDTGIARRTLYAWQSNRVDRFDGDVIEKLCNYFEVGLPDLLELVPPELPQPKQPKQKTARK